MSTKTVYVMVLKKVKLKVIFLVKEFCYMTKRTTQKWKVPSYNDRVMKDWPQPKMEAHA